MGGGGETFWGTVKNRRSRPCRGARAVAFAVTLKPHARGADKICKGARTNARIVFQMIGCDVIQANLFFSEKDSSDYGQSPGLPRNTPLAAPYGWVLKPRAQGLMTERMCRAHAEGCSGGGGDGLKKNTHQVFGLERLRKVSWAAAGAGRRRGSPTHLQQKAGDRRPSGNLNFHTVRSFSPSYLFICLNVAAPARRLATPPPLAGVCQVNAIGAKSKPGEPILSANMHSCQRGEPQRVNKLDS